MTTYFIKMILCSALFFLAYKLLFENEKMLRFNRFFLLFSIVFSFLVPVITIQTNSQILPAAQTIMSDAKSLNTYSNTQTSVAVNENNTLPLILLSIYLTITTLLLFRFGINLKFLFSRIANSPVIHYNNAKLVLINDNLIPHSFLNCIFINAKDYSNGEIENEILLHELTHVEQKHSIDVLFIELVQAIFWFNPVFIFYGKAIPLNHEFLADDRVINSYHNTLYYQRLLIDKASQNKSLFLTSQLNYSITKKRLIMMTKSTSVGKALCRQLSLIPLLTIAVFLFTTQVHSQDSPVIKGPQAKSNEIKSPSWVGLSVGSTKEGVSKELLNEYEAIVNKYKTANKKWGMDFQKNISKADRDRLEKIFKQMNEDQQSKQAVVFMKPAPPLPKAVPTKEQLKSWKNSKIYGLWINEKKVSNSVLNNYTNTDFSQVFVSKLYGAAKKNVNYFYQVDLMTREYYQKYYERAIADKDYIMIARSFKKVG